MSGINPYPEIVNSNSLSKLRGASFGHINIRSLFPKHDEVYTLLHRSDLDYLGITETWLGPGTENYEISVLDTHFLDSIGNWKIAEEAGVLQYILKIITSLSIWKNPIYVHQM